MVRRGISNNFIASFLFPANQWYIRNSNKIQPVQFRKAANELNQPLILKRGKEKLLYFKDAQALWGRYLGSGKKPKDFDEFWNNGKKIIESLPKTFDLVPHEIFSHVAKGYDLFFTAHDGNRIHCQFIVPMDEKKKYPTQFQFHGYHGNSGDWSDKIGLAAEGYCVIAMDVRGQGGISEDSRKVSGGTLKGHIIRGVDDGPDELFYRQVFLDVYHLVRIACCLPQVDENQLSVYGASQGGALAIVCAALSPSVKQIFTLYPFLSDYREAFRLEVTQSAYEELAYWFRFRDPSHAKEESFFSVLDYIDIQYLAERVQGEVFWGIGLADTICHPKTQFAVFNQLQGAKEMIDFPEYGHEYIPLFSDFMRKKLIGGKMNE